MRLSLILIVLVVLVQCNSTKTKPIHSDLDSLSYLIQKDSLDFSLLSKRAKLYLQENNIKLAKKDIDQAYSVFKNDVNVLSCKGDIYFDLNETRIAKDSWQRCLIIDPNQLDCRIKLTNLLCAVRDPNCRIMIDTLAKLQKGIVSPSIIAYLKELKEYESALDLLTNLLGENSNNKEALSLLSLIYSDTTKSNNFFNIELAEKYFTEIINKYPNDFQVYYNYGKHKQNISQYNEALDLYQKGAQLNKNSKQLFYNMGFCALELKDYNQAISYFTSAIAIDNSFLIAYHARAYTHTLNGDIKKAQFDWKNCLMLNPSYIPALEGLSR
tara:strand:+ start:24 stop:1001 length:978 start_codon:yes stop_codon:yes gene_type:complete